ncbi:MULTISPECIES: glycosyltransferase family 39 protein [unclassified Streptomyces]|uniref:glycosyltransferase family 39 protein n=1 Tax=unclassified Streptomyces TaxID=2593676 RepID=UPI001CBBFC43|nr:MULTISPECIES: glycosyltransferase family 39 protein [unclassified Streptomyces]WPO74690.1 glycosyltransferase family 39 protein [Streptomyces sp. KN37]
MTDLDQRPSPPSTGFALRRAAPALAVYAGVRALGLAVLAVWGAVAGKSPHTLLAARWDSLWYTRVAEHGYGWEVTLPDGSVHSNLAFFPLLPWLERLGAAVSPLSYADAGLAVSWLASLFAAAGIFAVTDHLYGRRAGVCAVALWAVLPVGVVQSMAYSESLFTALAAWSLYALLREDWILAGLLASLAGLTRPVGAAVVAAIWVTAAVRVHRERRAGLRMLLGVLLAPLGAAGYVLWVGHRTGGGLFGYLDVQAGWGNGFDFGYAFARFIGDKFTSVPGALAGLGLIVGVALVVWLYVVGVRQRQPLPLLLYTGIVVALALCAAGYFGSKPRLLLPAFPLLLPLAVALARLRTSRSALVLGGVAVAGAVYGAFWLHGSGPP